MINMLSLIFNRLDKKNGITSALYSLMVLAIKQARTAATMRIGVIRGQESIFSRANEIGDFYASTFHTAGELVSFPARIAELE